MIRIRKTQKASLRHLEARDSGDNQKFIDLKMPEIQEILRFRDSEDSGNTGVSGVPERF